MSCGSMIRSVRTIPSDDKRIAKGVQRQITAAGKSNMKADFLDAHLRHWDDAELLYNATRWANADHLYGLAAECGLKRLMIAFGMDIDRTTGSPKNQQDRIHADQAWLRYESYRSGHHDGVNHPLPTIDPFVDWKVNQRYAQQANFTQEIAEAHRIGAKIVHDLVTRAILEGIVS